MAKIYEVRHLLENNLEGGNELGYRKNKTDHEMIIVAA